MIIQVLNEPNSKHPHETPSSSPPPFCFAPAPFCFAPVVPLRPRRNSALPPSFCLAPNGGTAHSRHENRLQNSNKGCAAKFKVAHAPANILDHLSAKWRCTNPSHSKVYPYLTAHDFRVDCELCRHWGLSRRTGAKQNCAGGVEERRGRSRFFAGAKQNGAGAKQNGGGEEEGQETPGRIKQEARTPWQAGRVRREKRDQAPQIVPAYTRKGQCLQCGKWLMLYRFRLKKLRPISLTPDPILAKVYHRQYGVLKGKPNTHYLTSLIHHLASTTDEPGYSNTLVLTDFTRAFDRVHHITAVKKLLDMGRVKYRNVVSDWETLSCGVPQGTTMRPRTVQTRLYHGSMLTTCRCLKLDPVHKFKMWLAPRVLLPPFESPDAKFHPVFPALPLILSVKALLSSIPGLNPRHAFRDTLLSYTEHRRRLIRLCPVRAKLPAPANDAGLRTVETMSCTEAVSVKFAMSTLRSRLQQEFTS
ncbi:hypothetical protein Bbelb_053560 [Branchiostoma belcheri]|nr:hypothetical protein Bbelb_053560 [Branchiostoma belcheri]